MIRSAYFSPDKVFCYALWRDWSDDVPVNQNSKGTVMFIGFNPSNTDEAHDDPTTRRCIAFAQHWGYKRLCVTNLFAFRADYPKNMMHKERTNRIDIVGPENNRYLKDTALVSDIIIAAWGIYGFYNRRDIEVVHLIDRLYCIGMTRYGKPYHPLYAPIGKQPQLFWANEQ